MRTSLIKTCLLVFLVALAPAVAIGTEVPPTGGAAVGVAVPPTEGAAPEPVAGPLADAPAGGLPAERDLSLYQGQVTLISQGAGERRAATARALALVLVKLTGQPSAAGNPVVRRAMAKAMEHSHQTVVPVSITDEVDLRHWRSDEDVTVRLIKAIGVACRAEPSMNAWFDGDTLSRRLFKEVNVAIAVDSKHGLYVPVMENVAERERADIRQGLDRMIADVKARAVPREMLQGATITLTNFGAIAGRYASPIVTPPQVAIIGAGKLFEKVVFIHGEARPVRALPLSMTFDHRACTGGEAARFLKALVQALEAPAL